MRKARMSAHLYEAEPSLALSQKQLLTVCSPAPLRCIMTHVTTYLKGLPSATCEILSAFSTCLLHTRVHDETGRLMRRQRSSPTPS